MKTKLPKKFIKSTKELFKKANMQAEFSDFIDEISKKDWHRAYRITKANIDAYKLAEVFAYESLYQYEPEDFLKEVPFAKDAYYLPQDFKAGKSQAFSLGLIYIQEASAMLAAEVLDAQPGEKIMDLCAAPGGKSSQLATALNRAEDPQSLLVANDISKARAGILSENLSRSGFKDTVVTSFDPIDNKFLELNREQFDAVQLDVPCSSEAMFRRQNSAIRSWYDYGPKSVVDIQAKLLDESAKLLKAGGRLVYSTCTFNYAENEEQISKFLDRHKDFYLLDASKHLKSQKGIRKALNFEDKYDLDKCIRVWPQDQYGEGHFVALLQKSKDAEPKRKDIKLVKKKKDTGIKEISKKEALSLFNDFLDTYFTNKDFPEDKDYYFIKNNALYLKAETEMELVQLNIVKPSFKLAEFKDNQDSYKLIPSFDLIKQSSFKDINYKLNLNPLDIRVPGILKGQTLVLSPEGENYLAGVEEQGYIAIYIDEVPLTWMKKNGKTLKNLMPKFIMQN